MMKIKKKRSKNLGDQGIRSVVSILDGWSGPLTWNALIEAVQSRLRCRYTRQALHKHELIRIAFEVRKKANPQQAPTRGSVQLQKAMERMARLEAENQRLRAESDLLNEKFVVWAYNAYVHGLGEKELNRSLPEIDRRQSPMLVRSLGRRATS